MSVNKLMSAVLISSLMMSSSYAAINQAAASEDAFAVKVQGIRNFADIDNVFSQYQYEMDGWDGSDLNVKREAELRLHEDLNNLMASGVSAKEIQSVMEGRILSPKARGEYRMIVEALKVQKASPDEISKVAMNFMNSNQASGSAFSSSDGARINYKRIAVIAGAVILAAVIVISIKNCKDKKGEPPQPPVPPVPPSDPQGNNGWGNGDQDAPGGSCSHNNAENYDCA